MQKFILPVILSVFTLSNTAHAELERRGPSLTAKVGTSGLGAEVTYGLNELVRIRAGAYGFAAGVDTSTDDFDYDLDLRLLSGGGYVDLHPFKGRFRFTGGFVYNGNRLDATGTVNGEFVSGNNTFTAAEIGELEGRIDFNDFAPYAGIGWGSPFKKGSNWAFEADIGVIFQGAPEVSLQSVGGSRSNDQLLIDAVQGEEDELQDELDFFQYYPIISVGVAYTF
ncbi:MAG: hypothetical protein AAF607_14660 [Pseudomonadota bacterium]